MNFEGLGRGGTAWIRMARLVADGRLLLVVLVAWAQERRK